MLVSDDREVVHGAVDLWHTERQGGALEHLQMKTHEKNVYMS